MYTYDDAGNILEKTEYAYTTGNVGTATASLTYTYGNTNWGDLLTAYDDHAITTDTIGNPTSFYDGYAYTMEWEHGRQLKSVTYGNVTTRYQYNADGIRIKKTLSNGTWHEFHVMGGTIIGETRYNANGSVALWMRYNMDADGSIYGISTWYPGDTSWTDYYFVKNLQGDVIEVRQASTNTVVASYTYDAWGNVLSESGTLAHINRFRYRSYYFDEETWLYYLQSRYYDPALGRFINADAFASTGQGVLGNNMFAYCGNNPVNIIDPDGRMWKLILGAVILAVALGGCSSSVGAAPEYVEIAESDGDRDSNPNCYSYAIGIYDKSHNPGDFSSPFKSYDIASVTEAVVSDMINLGRSVRIINGPDSPVEENEYRIALRVSEPKYYSTPNGVVCDWDYHFMVQTNTGCWAEKHGPGGATVYHSFGNPNTISWDLGNYAGYYTSNIVYFAISRG